jgi:hypothetical protein
LQTISSSGSFSVVWVDGGGVGAGGGGATSPAGGDGGAGGAGGGLDAKAAPVNKNVPTTASAETRTVLIIAINNSWNRAIKDNKHADDPVVQCCKFEGWTTIVARPPPVEPPHPAVRR